MRGVRIAMALFGRTEGGSALQCDLDPRTKESHISSLVASGYTCKHGSVSVDTKLEQLHACCIVR